MGKGKTAPRKNKLTTAILYLLLFLLYRFFSFFICLLPRSIVLSLGAALGFLAYTFSPRHRRISQKNLSLAFGSDLSQREKRLIARRAFLHFGRMILDTIKYSFLDEAQRNSLVTIQGLENLKQALSLGRGVIIFSAHLGNWEIASWTISRLAPLYVIARPIDNPWLEKEWQRIRENLGAKVISKFQAARPVLRSLQAGGVVAILIDQNVLRSQAVFVDFFGRPAATTPSVASFHLKTNAPVISVFCLMQPDHRYLIKISPPLSWATNKGALSARLLQITQVLTKMIEQEIRLNLEQWLWFHDRWRTRPLEEETYFNQKKAAQKKK